MCIIYVATVSIFHNLKKVDIKTRPGQAVHTILRAFIRCLSLLAIFFFFLKVDMLTSNVVLKGVFTFKVDGNQGSWS